MKQRVVEKEWKKLRKAEKAFLDKNREVRTMGWQKKVEQYVPQKLNNTLQKGFEKAFDTVFQKGTGIIEKTYNKEKRQQTYRMNEITAEVKQNRRSLKAFSKQAAATKTLNMALSTAEGVGMGVLGMGLPDIPIFLSLLLKSIYEIAMSYGFSYETEEEQIFILKLIRTAVSHGADLFAEDAELNLWMEQGQPFGISRKEQIEKTATALSEELLYLKFIQGIPVMGMVGGLSDMVYQKKITDYAALKYQRRFLTEKYR